MQPITSNVTNPVLELKEVSTLVIDPKQVKNSVLERLINEVQVEQKLGDISAYNRTHNRHNRGR